MAEAHLDHPGEIHWFKGEGPLPILGPGPHRACKHLGTGVIAWGPSMDRYELVACGSIDPADESADDCASTCRAWVDGQGRTTTAWLHIDHPRAAPDPGRPDGTPEPCNVHNPAEEPA